jgi:hypothetical protein
MALSGLRLEYALEGISNYISWKDRMEEVLEDSGLKEFIDKDVPKPDVADAANLDAWQKKVEKERRILLEGGQDHIVSNLHGKSTPCYNPNLHQTCLPGIRHLIFLLCQATTEHIFLKTHFLKAHAS